MPTQEELQKLKEAALRLKAQFESGGGLSVDGEGGGGAAWDYPKPSYHSTLPQMYNPDDAFTASRDARRATLAKAPNDLPTRYPTLEDTPTSAPYQPDRGNETLTTRRDKRAQADEFWPSWARPIVNAPADLYDQFTTQTSVGRAIDRFSKGARNAIPGGAPLDNPEQPLSTGNRTVDKVADVAGYGAGLFSNVARVPLGGFSDIHQTARPLAENLGARISMNTMPLAGRAVNKAGDIVDSMGNRMLTRGIQEGATLGAWDWGQAQLRGEDPIGAVPHGLEGAALGGVIGAAMPPVGDAFRFAKNGISDGIRRIRGRGAAGAAEETITPPPDIMRPAGATEPPLAPEAPARPNTVLPQEPPIPDNLSPPRLDRRLALARTNYNYGREPFGVEFQSDVDKALYIVARTSNRSRHDEAYMDFLRGVLNKPDAEIRGLGMEMRNTIKSHVQEARRTGDYAVTVPDSMIWRPRPTAGAQTAPQAAQAATPASGFTPTHRVREGKAGAGTEVSAYVTGARSDVVRFRSQDGQVRGYIPAQYADTHLEALGGGSERAAAEVRAGRAQQTAARDEVVDFNGDVAAPQGTKTRGLYDTVESTGRNPEAMGRIADKTYGPNTHQGLIAKASARINEDPGQAFAFVHTKDARGNLVPLTDEMVETGRQLLDFFTYGGEDAMAAQVLERLATGLTESGRAVNAAKLMTRLSREGAQLAAQRIKVASHGEGATLSGAEQKSVVKAIDNLKSAQSTQDKGKLLYDILDRVEGGKPAVQSGKDRILLEGMRVQAESELNRMARETAASAQKGSIGERFLDKLAREAKKSEQWLKNNRNRLNAIPAEEYKHYAKIATYHVANGAVRFADFSTQMVQRMGGNLEPKDLKQLYVDAISRKARAQGQKMESFERALGQAIRGGNLNADEALTLRVMAKDLTMAGTEFRRMAMGELQTAFMQLQKPSKLERFAAFQTIEMLWNAVTLGANAIGGSLVILGESLARRTAATLFDIPQSFFTGQRAMSLRTNIQGKYWENWLRGGKMGWHGVNPDGFETAYELGGLKFVTREGDNAARKMINTFLSPMERSLYASMKSFDYANAMYAINKSMGETATLAYQGAKKAGTTNLSAKQFVGDYVARFYDELMAQHRKYGEYVTLQDENVLSTASVKAKRGLNSLNQFIKIKGKPISAGWGLGDIANKFPKAPANLLMRSLEYSPVGGVKHMFGLANALFTRTPMSRDTMMGLSRALVGTSLGMAGWRLGELGLVSAGTSGEQKIRDAQEGSGVDSYTVNVSGLRRWFQSGFDAAAAKPQKDDHFMSYGWAQPFAANFAFGAAIAQTEREDKQATGTTKAWNATDAAMTGLAQQSFAQGIWNMFDRTPGQGVLDKGMMMAAGVPQTLIPSTVKQTRRLADPFKREVNNQNAAASAKEQVMNGIPGWSDNLPQRSDNLGTPMRYYDEGNPPVANAAQTMLSPAKFKQYQSDPTKDKIMDAYQATGDAKVLPTKPGRQVSVFPGDPEVELTDEQFARYKEILKVETDRAMAKEKGTGTPAQRIERVADRLATAREYARDKVIKEYQLHKKKK